MSYHVFKIFMYHSNEKKNSREWCSACLEIQSVYVITYPTILVYNCPKHVKQGMSLMLLCDTPPPPGSFLLLRSVR